MAVKLRLRREGTKRQSHFRVVAADSRAPRDGRFLEILGEYHPMEDPSVIRIDPERALHWLRNGARPTDAVQQLLYISGVWEEFRPGTTPDDVTIQESPTGESSDEAPGEEGASDEPATGEVSADEASTEEATAEEATADEASEATDQAAAGEDAADQEAAGEGGTDDSPDDTGDEAVAEAGATGEDAGDDAAIDDQETA